MQLNDSVTYVQVEEKYGSDPDDRHNLYTAYVIGCGRVKAFNDEYVLVQDVMMQHHIVKVSSITENIIANLQTF